MPHLDYEDTENVAYAAYLRKDCVYHVRSRIRGFVLGLGDGTDYDGNRFKAENKSPQQLYDEHPSMRWFFLLENLNVQRSFCEIEDSKKDRLTQWQNVPPSRQRPDLELTLTRLLDPVYNFRASARSCLFYGRRIYLSSNVSQHTLHIRERMKRDWPKDLALSHLQYMHGQVAFYFNGCMSFYTRLLVYVPPQNKFGSGNVLLWAQKWFTQHQHEIFPQTPTAYELILALLQERTGIARDYVHRIAQPLVSTLYFKSGSQLEDREKAMDACVRRLERTPHHF